jgi:hypothetical protein
MAQYLKPLLGLAYCLTLPTKAELLGDEVITLMDRMSTRYAEQLGIAPTAIGDGHRALVQELFSDDNDSAGGHLHFELHQINGVHP